MSGRFKDWKPAFCSLSDTSKIGLSVWFSQLEWHVRLPKRLGCDPAARPPSFFRDAGSRHKIILYSTSLASFTATTAIPSVVQSQSFVWAICLSEISISEQLVCERLATLLNGRAVGDSLGDQTTCGDILSAFEFFLPEVLRELHREWRGESLDGVYPTTFRKTGDREIELVGLALFISDQTLTPLHLHLQLSPTFDRVSWIEIRLGERTIHGCRREPYGGPKAFGTMRQVVERLDSIDWYYRVGYGERES